MDDLTLHATDRKILKKKVRFLRRQGITPTHLLGHNVESLTIQCDTTQLQHIIAQAGMSRPINLHIEPEKRPRTVFIKEVQRDEVKKQLLHVDFYQVKKGEKIALDVPIVLVGESPAMKEKGRMLAHGITSLSIECLPESVPPQIEVDISQLGEIEQPINVRDIILDPSITVHADPDQLIVKVSEALVKAEEEVVEEAAVEGEAAAPTEEAPEQQPSD
ncbi:50S ribosomal protein L25 [Chloroflexota bacterium]